MTESSALLQDGHDEDSPLTRRLFDRKDFLRRTILLLSTVSLLWTLTVITILRFWKGWLLPVVCVALLVVIGCYLLLTLYGFYVWRRGDLPLDSKRRDPIATYLQTPEGRTIEYFVWGSTSTNATAMVVLHGSSTTGKYLNQFLWPDSVMRILNVKVISPSFPGHGGSDTQPFRRIKDWPVTDLLPILQNERIQTFIVQGIWYGTSHAMATASILKDRCLAMGLVIPYLPEPICREFGFHTDADTVLKESQFHQPAVILPVISLLSLGQGFFGAAFGAYPESAKAMAENPEFFVAMSKDLSRSFLRGVYGQAFELLDGSIAQNWPDPRSIETPVVAVWYAEDDSCVSPAHGKWLAGTFEQKKSIHTNIRIEKKGLGHFTYFGADDTDTGLQTDVLLNALRTR